jgi:hypothetical protein
MRRADRLLNTGHAFSSTLAALCPIYQENQDALSCRCTGTQTCQNGTCVNTTVTCGNCLGMSCAGCAAPYRGPRTLE